MVLFFLVVEEDGPWWSPLSRNSREGYKHGEKGWKKESEQEKPREKAKIERK